jgi:hypothetical protein
MAANTKWLPALAAGRKMMRYEYKLYIRVALNVVFVSFSDLPKPNGDG